MQLIDFNNSKGFALAHGFMKGLAAPVMLFHFESAPSVPTVNFLKPATITDYEAIKHDWEKIGNDIKAVVTRHEQTKTSTN